MSKDKNREPVKKNLDSAKRFRAGILFSVTILFSIILFPNLIVTKHQYNLGDVAERDIKSPRDFFIEDKALTEANRQHAQEAVLTVYDYDAGLAASLTSKVDEIFTEMRAAAATASEDPLKQPAANDATGQVVAAVGNPAQNVITDKRKYLEEKLGIRVSTGAFMALEKAGFSEEISAIINQILLKILNNGVVTNKEILLKESDKGIHLRDVSTKEEKEQHQLNNFYGLDQAKTMVRIVGQPLLYDLDYGMLNLVVDFVQRLLQPNVTLNRSETQERKNKVKADVKPVLHKIKAGEMLLREGERVTEVQLLKLKTLETQSKNEQVFLTSVGAAMLLLLLLVSTYILHLRRPGQPPAEHNKSLLFMASVFLTFFFLAEISSKLSEILTFTATIPIQISSIWFGIPLASGAMIICLFMGLQIAIPLAVVMAFSFAVVFENSLFVFLYFMINGSMAAYWIRHCRERKIFITAGAKLGLLNVLLVTAFNFYLSEISGPKLLWDWALAFLNGIGTGIVAAGLAPLVEIAFGYTTDISLLELANLDRPILRRLMIEAPGTYHHSVIVGSLVEAAASEIGANHLLAKVCGYYHDIGKSKKPLYFIENQRNGKNKHDKLAPSMSSLILIAHVKEGVEIARKNKLGQIIIDTIRQHHGTSLIKYFYAKAKQLKGEDKVNIDDFRYPGPKPQTREAGLVMLADVVEAASRTLYNPTPSRIQGLVQNLINNIFSDGQLDECELTLKDLHKIARSFNQILNGIYHHRIEYTEKRKSAGENGKGRLKNGSPDRQQAKQVQNPTQADTANGSGHLKRLGLS
ncbi:MAG: HDIG domain-containing protein [Deltaproteobacteria bacterium]|jgi:putative nucleotidyltransferase with HDIG domain|nr:HDIG domain-containing protein [Deltaproteobacteria bacterium]